ncbi:YjbF family lipoprotein [Aliiglaciecola sp. LCG003]|uniref:YjbF family lipoprotein n=1 Tax=Aliiglaciecola sp. LCG003 TaxID=3053655 RepID=UPI002572749F|nr:YjbF family lipoprotein [Aliiglaciecola sp. LCG003]WJG09489.1 YjbF family lipoprotein [Aliiglaciecola sp. LCG003]
MKTLTSILFLSVIILTGCSSTQQAYKRNIEMYFENELDVLLTDQQVSDSPNDLIYIKVADRPVVTMGLAFIESNQYKWISADDALLVTQYGRAIRTRGFGQDLIYTSNLDSDPLKKSDNVQTGESWQRTVDFATHQFGTSFYSHFSRSSDTTLIIQQREFQIIRIDEEVNFNSQSLGESTWMNSFWYDKKSGNLLKSRQKTTPKAEVIDITYISRALRVHKDSHE